MTDSILANPSDFYLNLHTSDAFGAVFAGFPAGAIRGQIGQVPEPSTVMLLMLGLAGLALHRSRSLDPSI